MVMQVTEQKELEKTEKDMRAQVAFGRQALHELRLLVRNRPDRLIINGKQYLEFSDWQILGAFFGITPYIVNTQAITETKNVSEGIDMVVTIGFLARAEARQNGNIISAAEAECMFEEKNWKSKPRFQVRSMAETRACAKVLRQCLQWVVKLPDEKGTPPPEAFADESAEEADQQQLFD